MTSYPFRNRGEPTVSADNRTVATDALATLGTIIGENEKRDAIHLAVEPMIAAHMLRPGDHVGLLGGGKAGHSEKPVGIADPYLTANIKPGERFWLLLYPGQVTSLRHTWTHPAFEEQATEPSPPLEPKPGLAEEVDRLLKENNRLQGELNDAREVIADEDGCRSMGCHN